MPRIRYKKQYPRNHVSPAKPTRHALSAIAAIELMMGLVLDYFVIKMTIVKMISVVITQIELIKAIVPYTVL
jgi:hypothetical protein